MSERDDRYVGNELPRTTGEFRAAPDISASTAEFRAFAAGQTSTQQTDTGSWPEQPWAGEAPSSGSSHTVAIVVGVVVAVVVIVALILIFA
jgi:hypothetical protein